MTENQTTPVSDGDYRLPDEELRRLAESPGRWSRPLALETIAHRQRIADLEHEITRLRAACNDVGEYIKALNQIALDATDMHDVINEKGDGDWQVVWENVADLGEQLHEARRRLNTQRDKDSREYRDLHTRCEELVAERDEARRALEVKTRQHAETLGYLEQAQRVIERDSAAYGRLLRALWQSRRLWQERGAEVEAERDAAISIARSNSHALDEAQADMETTAIELLAAHRRIAELEATQRHRLVETAEELDALPIGSVVLTIESRTAWENIAESVSLWANCGAALTAANLLHNYGTVIVVWTPELEAQVQR